MLALEMSVWLGQHLKINRMLSRVLVSMRFGVKRRELNKSILISFSQSYHVLLPNP